MLLRAITPKNKRLKHRKYLCAFSFLNFLTRAVIFDVTIILFHKMNRIIE